MAGYEEKGEKDRIFELPRPLLDNIPSEIFMKDVASSPFLSFDEEKFYFSRQDDGNNTVSVPELHWKNAGLMKKAVQMVLSRCQEEDPPLLTLRWVIPKYKSWEKSSLEFIPNLAKTGLQELSVINNYRSLSEEYLNLSSLSPLILPVSIKKLYFYRVEGFKSLLPYGTVKFKDLSTIELEDVVMVDDELLNGLNLVCPSLGSLKILNCNGLKNLVLTGLSKLRSIVLMGSSIKTFKIESSSPQIEVMCIKFNNLSRVDIINTDIKILKIKWNPNLSWVEITDANIETLSIQYNENLSSTGIDITNTNMDCVRKLKLRGDFLTQDLFNKFVCKCRFLKILYISDTENLKKIDISMNTLEIIIIEYVEKLVEIEIKAPMLKQIEFWISIYTNPPTVSWNFPNPKTLVDIYVDTITDYDWCHYLPTDDKLESWQDFFRYFNHAEDLQFDSPIQFLIWLKGKQSVSPLPYVKNIVYYNEPPESSHPMLHLLESLIFLAPQATTISLNNNANTIILSLEFGEKEDGETPLFSSKFPGIEAWMLTVSKITVQKYHGPECDWKELIKFVNKFKNLEFVFPQKEENFEIFY